MKKLIVIILLILVLLSINSKDNKESKEERAIFISYIELSKYLNNKDNSISKLNIDRMIHNIKKTNINTIILQVRSNQDAIYKSNIYPSSKYINNSFDYLNYFIKKAHYNNIKLIAWINPYRISTTDNINSIDEYSPAYKYINTDYLYISNGIYFNPSKKEVEDLIVKGVDEVLNYEVDGILFDDYFYQSNNIDVDDYNKYLENHDSISIDEYHLYIINKMVERVHKECIKKNILFGISPDGNIDNNYNKNMADVRLWMSSDKYIDFIMPQIYYGFYNSTRDYVKVVKEWEGLLKNDNIKFYVALAFYKVGIEDAYAKEGRDEWKNNNDIIMREVILSRNLKGYSGFALFRYDSLFDNYTDTSKDELENLKKIIK